MTKKGYFWDSVRDVHAPFTISPLAPYPCSIFCPLLPFHFFPCSNKNGKVPGGQKMALVPCEHDLSFLYKHVIGALDSYFLWAVYRESGSSRRLARQSFFRYDNNKDLKVCFLVMCVTCEVFYPVKLHMKTSFKDMGSYCTCSLHTPFIHQNLYPF